MLAKQSTAHQKPWSKHNPIPLSANFLTQTEEYVSNHCFHCPFQLSFAFI